MRYVRHLPKEVLHSSVSQGLSHPYAADWVFQRIRALRKSGRQSKTEPKDNETLRRIGVVRMEFL